MPRDKLVDRTRAVFDDDAPAEPRVSATTPVDQLRHLAEHASSENVRMQASKVLLEREDERRERSRRERDEQKNPLADEISKLSTDELRREFDLYASGRVGEALHRAKRDPDDWPETSRVIEAEVEHRVQAHVRELADTERIESEIERRAAQRAQEMYRHRAFEVVERADVSSPSDEGQDGGPKRARPEKAGGSADRDPYAEFAELARGRGITERGFPPD